MSNKKLAVVGSANVDLVFESSRFPEPGQTVLGHGFGVYSGGKGANQAVAAAKLGSDVEFVGKLGSDDFGRMVIQNLKSYGVSVAHLLQAEVEPTGTAGIVVADGGENTIVVNPGANVLLYPDEVEDALEEIQPGYVLTQFEILPESVAAGAGRGRFQVNPAPARAIEAGLLSKIDLLTPNRSEAKALTGIDPGDEAQCALCCRKLLRSGVKNVVITLGKEGSFIGTNSYFQLVPTLLVKTVDTTGAGDTFNGALAAFLLQGRDLINAVVLANIAASLSTTRKGAQASMPTADEVRSVAGNDF